MFSRGARLRYFELRPQSLDKSASIGIMPWSAVITNNVLIEGCRFYDTRPLTPPRPTAQTSSMVMTLAYENSAVHMS